MHTQFSSVRDFILHFFLLCSFQGAKGHALKTEQCRSQMARLWRSSPMLLRKEVIQPHLPIRLPCYDFTPVIAPALGHLWTSGVNDFRGVTGGVYKARERIHRSMLTCDY